MKRTGILLLSFLLAGTAARADVCMTQTERDAHRVRHLQTQMMVGALQCRGIRDLGQRALYNDFVMEWKTELARHGAVLISWFEANEGATWKSRLDHHITELANRISAESRADPAFCAAIARLGEELRDSSSGTLGEVAARAPVPYTEPVPYCPGGERMLVTAQ